MKSNRILIACQSPIKEPYLSEIILLFKTLNFFGGEISNSQKLACISGITDTKFLDTLTKLGVETIITKEENSIPKHSNKIQILNEVQNLDYEVLVALDTDIVISRDFSAYVNSNNLSAMQDDVDPLGLTQWELIFKEFEISFPQNRSIAYRTMKKTIPYFNSGVLIIPKQFVQVLYETWKFFILSLSELYTKYPFLHHYSFYTDQIALTLAIHAKKIPFKPLPLEMNFPTHIDLHYDCKADTLSPFLFHHHHRTTKLGNIRHTWHYENINKIIDKINSRLTIDEDSQIIVDDIYRKVLLRPADELGLKYYSELIDTKKITEKEFEQILYNSDEYKSLKISDELTIGYDLFDSQRLKKLLFIDDYPDNLLDIINTSRKYFGWFTKHLPRIYEYPWLISNISEPENKKILDIGAGVTPLPIILAEKNGFVITVDNHSVERKKNDDPSSFNEWGYFDYSAINQNISSYNNDITKMDFPSSYFDYVFSISVLEHMSSDTRKQLWKKLQRWVKNYSKLFFTVDLIANTRNLWNYGGEPGEIIEDIKRHGTIDDISLELMECGFKQTECIIKDFSHIPSIKLDVVFLTFIKMPMNDENNIPI